MSELSEIEQLRGNAENLAKCLHALLEKIEDLEKKQGGSKSSERNNGCELHVVGDEDEREKIVSIEDNITTDPVTGLKKRTIVTERVLTTKTFHSLALDDLDSKRSVSNGKLLCPAYQSRAVKVDARQLNQIEVELISGQLVVTKVNSAAKPDIHPGDTITEINGDRVINKRQIRGLNGKLVLTLVPAPIYNAPPVFYRVLEDYSSSTDEKGCKWLPIELRNGDVIQVMSEDSQFTQGRKVNDLSKVGYIPTTLPKEKVSMLAPFGRRVLVLLGSVGVGRRTLKSMLIRSAPDMFATVVPLTSRAPRVGEQEGREYVFLRKEEILQKIRDGHMVEWGELDNQLYGTSADSIRSVVRSGRMSVIDCAPQALAYLYNGEFMPFVVHIVPPPLEEFIQLEHLRHVRRPVDELSKVCSKSDEIAKGPFASQIHLTLINRNMDVTFKRLTDALENLRYDTQWVPDSWMC